MNRDKRRHGSSSKESDVEELHSFYHDPIDFFDSCSSDEGGEVNPLGDGYSDFDADPLGDDDSDCDDDPLGDTENCVSNFEFNDPVEADEFNFDEFDDGGRTYEDFESEEESDTDADTEDSDDTDENEATVSKATG